MIVIAGLLLVLLAAVTLAFWCCRGAFENPCVACRACGRPLTLARAQMLLPLLPLRMLRRARCVPPRRVRAAQTC